VRFGAVGLGLRRGRCRGVGGLAECPWVVGFFLANGESSVAWSVAEGRGEWKNSNRLVMIEASDSLGAAGLRHVARFEMTSQNRLSSRGRAPAQGCRDGPRCFQRPAGGGRLGWCRPACGRRRLGSFVDGWRLRLSGITPPGAPTFKQLRCHAGSSWTNSPCLEQLFFILAR